MNLGNLVRKLESLHLWSTYEKYTQSLQMLNF